MARGSRVPPAGSRAEPRPKTILAHFNHLRTLLVEFKTSMYCIVYGLPYRVSTQQAAKLNKQHRLKLNKLSFRDFNWIRIMHEVYEKWRGYKSREWLGAVSARPPQENCYIPDIKWSMTNVTLPCKYESVKVNRIQRHKFSGKQQHDRQHNHQGTKLD